MPKPITIEKVNAKKWHVYVNDHPVVKVDGKLNYGPELPILVPHAFKSKSEAEGVAHTILRYKLNMGDMLFAHTEYRNAKKEG